MVSTVEGHALDCSISGFDGALQISALGGDTEPLGGHKGYGYGMLCEIFCSIFSGGLTSNHTHIGGKGGTCHGFAAINPEIFGDSKAIIEHLSVFLDELRNAPKADGATAIYTHGQKEILAYADRVKNGIDVNVNTVAEMLDFCEFAGLSSKEYLGDITLDTVKKMSSYN